MELLFVLVIGHFIGDFVLQHDTMAVHKSRHAKTPMALEDNENFPAWYYWLSSHAMVHGLIVYLATQSLVLGLIEIVIHWLIDFSKCEDYLSFNQDQLLHIICKCAYCYILAMHWL